MRQLLTSVLLSGLTLIGARAHAALGTADVVPAATLLVPYFEVDLNAATGVDTKIAVTNATASNVLTNVTIWTDLGYPVKNFNVYFTGYDVVAFGMRDVLQGTLPATSNGGMNGCTGLLPPPALDAAAATGLQTALTGQQSTLSNNECSGQNKMDNHARGYVTIDVVDACTASNPSTPGYFAMGGAGTAKNTNALLGDVFLVNQAANLAHAFSAVHIEALTDNAFTTTSGQYTFYGRYVGWNASDNREALATNWAIDYTNSAEQETRLLVWRDAKRPTPESFNCNTTPAFYPLTQFGVTAFDEQEGPTQLGVNTERPVPEQQITTPYAPFPAQASNVSVKTDLNVTARAGWLSLNFSNNVAGGANPEYPTADQSYVVALHFPKAFNGAPTVATTSEGTALDSGLIPKNTGDNPIDPPGTGGTIGVTGPSGFGTPDRVPAATLLLPYFEVDLNDSNGPNTTFTVINTSASAITTTITLWTDLGVPTFTINTYLTGYDLENYNLRMLFESGAVPRSASAGQDPSDRLSPKGYFSQDINFASCNGLLPYTPLSTSELTHLRAAHTGGASARWSGKCGGRATGDNIARGYVTIDTVLSCSYSAPGDAGYLVNGGGGGGASNQNYMTGQFTVYNRGGQRAHSGSLVAIEAGLDPKVQTAGNYTFYGREQAFQAQDNREALPGKWAARFIKGGASAASYGPLASGATELVVWRDPLANVTPFTCGNLPGAFPISHGALNVFDEEENVTMINGSFFPSVTQKVSSAAPALGIPYTSGFLQLDLNQTSAGANPPNSPTARQAHVSVVHTSANGTGYSLGTSAFALEQQ